MRQENCLNPGGGGCSELTSRHCTPDRVTRAKLRLKKKIKKERISYIIFFNLYNLYIIYYTKLYYATYIYHILYVPSILYILYIFCSFSVNLSIASFVVCYKLFLYSRFTDNLSYPTFTCYIFVLFGFNEDWLLFRLMHSCPPGP